MGTVKHHVINITSMYPDALFEAHNKAVEIFEKGEDILTGRGWESLISTITPGLVNGYGSFFAVYPDGSKEGREESDEGDRLRDEFVAWLRTQSRLDWVEVYFGDEVVSVRHPYDGQDEEGG